MHVFVSECCGVCVPDSYLHYSEYFYFVLGISMLFVSTVDPICRWNNLHCCPRHVRSHVPCYHGVYPYRYFPSFICHPLVSTPPDQISCASDTCARTHTYTHTHTHAALCVQDMFPTKVTNVSAMFTIEYKMSYKVLVYLSTLLLLRLPTLLPAHKHSRTLT